MKLKLDENLPESPVPALVALEHDVDSVRVEGLVGCSDAEIWQAAQQGGAGSTERWRKRRESSVQAARRS